MLQSAMITKNSDDAYSFITFYVFLFSSCVVFLTQIQGSDCAVQVKLQNRLTGYRWSPD